MNYVVVQHCTVSWNTVRLPATHIRKYECKFCNTPKFTLLGVIKHDSQFDSISSLDHLKTHHCPLSTYTRY